ncbi:hypothetical protein IIU_05847 [Bacillus cereus VD133]|uniref:ATLF-like domain-containing protein n=1 Tax=Bacillus cereus VD133 TaxID=1053233 RepID=A0A9W5PLC7_BACCE|nr:ADP-ribosyltransferase [Bacillus cereus]EOO28221.1 hypothetical protein IIU_05847 [Bacillus cereus VD133]
MQLKSMYKVLATTVILGQTMVAPILSHADTNGKKNEIQTMNKNDATDNRSGKLNTINLISDVEDYGKKTTEEAKKGIEKKVKEQEKKLTSEEGRAIKDLKNIKSTNDDLVKTDGKGTDPDKQKEIDKLDGILRKLRTDNTIKVYRSFDGMTEEQATNLKGKIQANPSYGLTSLTKPSGSDPLVEITVPKGSHAAYVTGENHSSELIIERGAGLEFTEKPTKVLDGNHYRIKIKARLLSSEEMKERQSKLNKESQSLSDTMKIPVSLEFSNVETAASIEKARKVITETNTALEGISKIIPTFNVSGLLKKLTVEGVHINIKDGFIKSGETFDGGYTPKTKELELDTTRNVIDTNAPLHELGHAIDHIFFGLNIKNDPNFKQIVSAELQSFLRSNDWEWRPQYADYYNDPREYWAEAFARFMTNNEKLKKEAPKTYQYIIDKLKALHL